MSLPARAASIRAYVTQLGALTKALHEDPLDEKKSLDLVAHIVENQPWVADQCRILATSGGGAR